MSIQDAPRRPRHPGYEGYGSTQWFRPQGGYQPEVSYADQPLISNPVYPRADENFPDQPARRSRRPRRPGVLVGAMTGLLAAALAVGVATLVAALVRPQSSPLIAVGEPFIDRVPGSLMKLAVQHFGMQDSMAALAIAALTTAVIAMIIGMTAVKSPAAGVTGIVLITVFGAFAVITRPDSHPVDVVPSVIGGLAGVAALMWLIRAAYVGIRG